MRLQADHVTANEDGALSYKLSIAEDDPDSILIFERYTSKKYVEEVRWNQGPGGCRPSGTPGGRVATLTSSCVSVPAGAQHKRGVQNLFREGSEAPG